jgi:hypothetical protein
MALVCEGNGGVASAAEVRRALERIAQVEARLEAVTALDDGNMNPLRCVTLVELARLTGFCERSVREWKGRRVDPLPTVLGKEPLGEGLAWMRRHGINLKGMKTISQKAAKFAKEGLNE